MRLMRLKDKLGNRSNASAEIEYAGAFAQRLGAEGEGVRTIIDMVHHTRLGTIAGTLGIMRAALAEAVHHCEHRSAFQKRLVDQPAMAGVLADLALESEAATVLALRCRVWWIAWLSAARMPDAEPVTQSSRVIATISMMVRTP